MLDLAVYSTADALADILSYDGRESGSLRPVRGLRDSPKYDDLESHFFFTHVNIAVGSSIRIVVCYIRPWV